MSPKSSVTLLRALCALCHLMVTMAKEDESDAGSEPPQPTIQSQVRAWAADGAPCTAILTDKSSASGQLPMLLASCVLAGLIASQAVYYDDDGDPTGVRPQHVSAALHRCRSSVASNANRRAWCAMLWAVLANGV